MDIRINRLVLENFKNHRYLNLEFNGKSAAIYGDNATGKTSIYDAFTWLLFGKDSTGNANAEIKPLNGDGQVRDHQAVTAVEAELTADGKIVTLRRTCREVWSARRGGDMRFEGNTSEFFVDGAPCRKFLFEKKIQELVSEELFRMLTSVGYFAAGMKWQDRRAVLLGMAGSQSDREIMEKAEGFAPLLEEMKGLTLEELKGKLLREKRGLNQRREDIPGRLDECQRVLDSLAGLEEAREREAVLSRKCQKLEDALGQSDDHSRRELALRERELEMLEEENRGFRREQQRRLEAARRELEAERRRLKLEESEKKRLGEALGRLDEASEKLETQRRGVLEREFSGGVCCPTCGQALPFGKLQEAMRRFREGKERELGALEEKRLELEKEREARLEALGALEASERRQRMAKLEGEAAGTVSDLPGFGEKKAGLREEIQALEERLAGLENPAGRAELEKARKELREVQALLGKAGVKAQMEQRAAQLRREAEEAGAALERVERLLLLLEEFVRFKARRAEESVNRFFQIATFRLFREQCNGGLEERCDVQYHGVPYLGLNGAMRVNVGIDIIGALSRYYGVKVPLFIDNAESITRLIEAPGQTIRLVVDEHFESISVKFC